MPPKTELILSPFSPASPGILDHELPLVAKRKGPRDDQIVPRYSKTTCDGTEKVSSLLVVY